MNSWESGTEMKKVVIGSVVFGLVLVGAYLLLARMGLGGAASVATPGTVSALPAVKAGDKVVADARVVPVRSAELSLPVGGMVAEVLVAEGDQVAAGQVMVRLDARQQTLGVAQAEATLARSKAVLARSRATLSQLKAGPREEDLAATRAAVRIAEAELARLRKGPDQSQLVAAQTNMEKAERAVQQSQFMYDRIKDLPDARLRSEGLKLEQATLEYDAAKAQYESLRAGPTQADLNVAMARVEQAQSTLAQLQAGARVEAIAAAEADVAAAEADKAAAEAGLAKARTSQADTELHAPFGGTVLTVNSRVGELVSPSNFIVRLADVSSWQIETQDLTELSVVRLRKGDPVSINIDAIPDLKLPGTIGRISEFGKTRQGDIVYTVVVNPARQDDRLRWNMTASVTIEPK